MKRIIHHLINIALILAFIFGATYVYKLSNKKKPEDLYRLERVTLGDIEQNVTANGTINPVAMVNVGTQVSGLVKNIYADFNDQVKQGQILLELEDNLFKAQIEQSRGNVKNCEASLELAKANEARMRSLFEKEYVSKQDLDQAVQALKSSEALLMSAKAKLSLDQTNYGYSIIKSPVSGIVIDRVEADIAKIQVGQSVKFSVDAYPNRTFEGTVKQIRLNPVNTANVVTYNIVILVENQEGVLLPGMTAYVTINFAHHEKVLLVPNAALRYQPKNENLSLIAKKNEVSRDGDKKKKEGYGVGKIYALRDNKPFMIRVNTGITNGKLTEVMSSEIKENDLIISGDLMSDQKSRSGAQGPSRPPRVF